ncbi:hypothetical protein B0H19DRAFT_1071987 [Mycena capillaripes]|nr:hypothetical protein B0H19DRAFT_1071987 [Mycena capillaripes]
MTTPTQPQPNLVPTIESTAMPTTPADEWAQSTHSVLGVHKPSTPVDMGPDIPGSWADQPPAASGGGTLLDTAKGYLPAQDDVQRAMTNVAQAAKGYLPKGVV